MYRQSEQLGMTPDPHNLYAVIINPHQKVVVLYVERVSLFRVVLYFLDVLFSL